MKSKKGKHKKHAETSQFPSPASPCSKKSKKRSSAWPSRPGAAGAGIVIEGWRSKWGSTRLQRADMTVMNEPQQRSSLDPNGSRLPA